jgi:hypothetical protein
MQQCLVCRNLDRPSLVYYRLPKTGSTSLVATLNRFILQTREKQGFVNLIDHPLSLWTACLFREVASSNDFANIFSHALAADSQL